jgi:sugar phosphate isomerase/epimerase
LLAGARRKLGKIGIQLYTVRALMTKEPEPTLQALAAIGYQEVEMAGLYGLSAAEMRQMLDRHHLAAPSGHVNLNDLRRDWPGALANAATLGHQYIVCASIDEHERQLSDYHRIAKELTRFGEDARRHGLQFAYHNHAYEFTPTGGEIPYDILIRESDPHLVQMQVDLFWMTKGGGDPLHYFAAYPGRFPMVHVKDMTRDGKMVDVGKGAIDFRAIFARSDEAGIRHYFVEHDEPPDPVADARVCYDYLRALEF